MAKPNGVESIKSLMTWGKLGTISFLQAVAKDGFQPSDVMAPLRSPLFMDTVEAKIGLFANALPELKHAGLVGWAGIVSHGRACWKDISTEFDLAVNKMEKLNQI